MDESYKAHFPDRYPLLSAELIRALRANTQALLLDVQRWEQLNDHEIAATGMDIPRRLVDFETTYGCRVYFEASKGLPNYAELYEAWWDSKEEADVVLNRGRVQSARARETEIGLRFRAKTAAKGGEAKKTKDPKQAAKREARNLWDEWKDGKAKFTGVEQWAMEVVRRHPILKSIKNVASWNAKWEKERFPNRRTPGKQT